MSELLRFLRMIFQSVAIAITAAPLRRNCDFYGLFVFMVFFVLIISSFTSLLFLLRWHERQLHDSLFLYFYFFIFLTFVRLLFCILCIFILFRWRSFRSNPAGLFEIIRTSRGWICARQAAVPTANNEVLYLCATKQEIANFPCHKLSAT